MEYTLSMSGYQDDIIPAELLEDFILEPLIQTTIKVASGIMILWSAVRRLFELMTSAEIRAVFTRLISAIPI